MLCRRLLFASNAAAGALPLASSLTLPLVPLLAGFPLRSAGPPLGIQRLAFSACYLDAAT